ncbi:MAG: SHOCT domain-containing protein [Sarcina sp.]
MGKRIRVKPSKGQSMAGFIGGLIFVGIGIFVAIPMAGAFGILWTIFAGVITITHGINVFGEKGIATHEIEVKDEYSKGELDFDERLRKLKALKDEGIITLDEYERKRNEILKEKW